METRIREGLRIETLREKHKNDVKKLLIDTLCSKEPLTRHLGIKGNEISPIIDSALEIAIKDELSVVCLINNNVVACTIATDMDSYPHIIPANFPESFSPIASLLNKLYCSFFDKNKPIERGKMAYVFLTATEKAHTGKFLNAILNKTAIEYAAIKKYDYAYTEFTNTVSEIISKRFLGKNAKLLHSIELDNFTFENKQVFAGLKHSVNSYLIVVNPKLNLDDY